MAKRPDWRCRIIIAICLLAASDAALGEGADVHQLQQAIQSGEFGEAVRLARLLDDGSAATTDLTLPLARLARSLERADRPELSAEFYQRALVASQQDIAQGLPNPTRVALRLAGGTALLKSGELPEAVAAVAPLLESLAEATSAQQTQMAVTICLHAGGESLAGGDWATAGRAYSLARQHADDASLATAMLGDAWALVSKGDQPELAAQKLTEFTDHFPEHHEAPKAALASVNCFRAADKHDAAMSATTDLLGLWPEAPEAVSALRLHIRPDRSTSESTFSHASAPEIVKSWIVDKAAANDLDAFDAPLCRFSIHIACQQNPTVAWSHLVDRLTSVDPSGRTTASLLAELSESESERLAMAIIAAIRTQSPPRSSPSNSSPPAIDAAVQWAAKTDRWSLLATVAEETRPDDAELELSAAAEKWFAESLMQVGRVEASIAWWNHLVDVRGANDFLSLLRCAEAETAAGDDADLANQRITAARQAAGESADRLVLTQLLEAELQVRRTNFDEARHVLAAIITNEDHEASIRQRAQWLTGETYYLQQKFALAIEAYRAVELIPGQEAANGRWIGAALIQAGKSFEQLGRTQAAVLCYGNLLNRFPDSAHAWLARQRMAVLDPQQRRDDAPDSSETIRR